MAEVAGPMLKYLRIAFSATCLIACVLLIALWVRSYWWREQLNCQVFNSPIISLTSRHGHLLFQSFNAQDGRFWRLAWFKFPFSPAERQLWDNLIAQHGRMGFAAAIMSPGFVIAIPHWFAIFAGGLLAFAVAPWPSWRFSLRTLLIFMTLLAVVLGIVFIAT